jgi:phosphate-selective porin OprO/OprP
MKNLYLLPILYLALLFVPEALKAQEVNYPNMKVNGRIMYDMSLINYGEESFAGQEFRRMMFTAKGNVNERIVYSAQFDFVGGKVGFRDVYIKLGKLPFIGGHLIVGNFAEPTGLDMLTSSKYISFIERAMLTGTQNFRWNSGFHYANHDLLNKNLGIQLAYTFNGDKNAAFIDTDVLGGSNLLARIYGTPFNNKEKNQVVHLGVNYERRDNPADSYKLSIRPETHFWTKINYADSVDLQNDLGAEIAATFGPLSLQGEYELSTQNIGDESYRVQGYYAYLSFFLTGEHRPYKKGTFGRVTPKSDFCALENKWGAVELLARYSVMDYSNANGLATFDGVAVEAVSNVTLGLNWYLNKYARVMYNFIWSDLSTDDNYTAHMFRAQVDF